jgi:methionyl-tRNA formyltransferase
MGTPDFAVPALAGLIAEGYQIAAVYTRPDAPAGRGRTLSSSPIKRLAESHQLEIRQPHSLRSEEARHELQLLNPDVIVVAAYGLILPQAVLDIPRLSCVNIHASLLPRHRGAAPIAAAIAAGDNFSGISIMRMDKGIDTGGIYSRAMIPIFDHDTTGYLTERLATVGIAALLDVLPQLESGTITEVPQPAEGTTYAPMLTKDDGRIDWRQSAVVIWRQARALQPWPGAFGTWGGKQLKLLETVPISMPTAVAPGTVVELPPAAAAPWGIATADGILGVCRLQMEGKRAVSASEFLRGQRGLIGTILE